MLIAVSTALATILVATNILIYAAACIEHSRAAPGEPWLSQSQTLAGMPDRPHVILLHGFGGSPFDLKSLALKLNGRGFRIVVPLMPDQTRQDGPFSRTGWTAETAMESVRQLAQREVDLVGRKPICIGFSMGGTLGALAAAEGLCSKLVLLAPFFGNPSLLRLADPLRFILPLIPKLSRGQINDPEGLRIYQPGTWFLSLSAFVSLSRASDLAKSSMDRIAVPALAFVAKGDRVSPIAEMDAALSRLKDVEIIRSSQANHILLFDHERTEIEERILEFVTDGPLPPMGKK